MATHTVSEATEAAVVVGPVTDPQRWARLGGGGALTMAQIMDIEPGQENAHIARWIQEAGLRFHASAYEHAAAAGRLDVIMWLRSVGCPLEDDGSVLIERAAAHGHLAVLEWALAASMAFESGACAAAAGAGHMDVLAWLRKEAGCPWDASACTAAARAGGLDMLKQLRSADGALGEGPCPWDEGTCAAAAEGGHLDVLRWLRRGRRPCPWDARSIAMAAAGGHMLMIRWMRGARRFTPASRNGGGAHGKRLRVRPPVCPWDASACTAAARGGHTDVLRYLRAYGAPWDATACSEAARMGRTETLAWMRAQDPPCPWGAHTTREAAVNGHIDCLVLAMDGGCACDVDLASAALHAGHAHIATWLGSGSRAMPSILLQPTITSIPSSETPYAAREDRPKSDPALQRPPDALASLAASGHLAVAHVGLDIDRSPDSVTQATPPTVLWSDEADDAVDEGGAGTAIPFGRDGRRQQQQQQQQKEPKRATAFAMRFDAKPIDDPGPEKKSRRRSGVKHRARKEQQLLRARAATSGPQSGAAVDGGDADDTQRAMELAQQQQQHEQRVAERKAAAVVRPQVSFAAAARSLAATGDPKSVPKPIPTEPARSTGATPDPRHRPASETLSTSKPQTGAAAAAAQAKDGPDAPKKRRRRGGVGRSGRH